MTTDVDRLILDARAGDPATLGRLLELYRNYLRLLARIEIGRRLQGKVDASDVVQEVFLDAHRYFPSFRGEAEPQFVHWLREILAGTLANQVRRYLGTRARDARLEREIGGDVNHSSFALGLIPADRGSSPSEHASKGEQTLLIAEALSRLPEDYQTVIVLRHLEGLSFPQIAERMGRTVDSVEKLWLRGLTKLRKAFGADQ
ncbi:sigma-70 family RNA polymerase sigma factor [Fimbriiglobus ruber]|uniref:Transcriptional control n=1 Tax=Fimbriiglobus ruber TaxID=1908690 RepID=A0A225CZF6_9BACT|nr:sigma-70 family RNA polymerase sigma factor [Fimbriiglobus ruber]OWK34750.1 transcriptional control [Fimbriiglobus ruber]